MTEITEFAWIYRNLDFSMFHIFFFRTKIPKTCEPIDIHTTPAVLLSNPWKFGKFRVKTFDAIEFLTPEVIKNTLYIRGPALGGPLSHFGAPMSPLNASPPVKNRNDAYGTKWEKVTREEVKCSLA